jgi:hypothetical protein
MVAIERRQRSQQTVLMKSDHRFISILDVRYCNGSLLSDSFSSCSATVVADLHDFRKKSVSFHPQVVTDVRSTHYQGASLIGDLWYHRNDYRRFKACFTEDAKQVARMNRSSIACTGDKENTNTVLSTFRACCQARVNCDSLLDLPPMVDCLDNTGDTFVGLERMAARKIAKDKISRRSQLVDAVFSIQNSCKSREAVVEDLQSVCGSISRPSRLFAFKLAQSVAKAA